MINASEILEQQKKFDNIVVRNGGSPSPLGCTWGIHNDEDTLHIYGFMYEEHKTNKAAILKDWAEYNAVPLFIPSAQYKKFYFYSNQRLWAEAHNGCLGNDSQLGAIYKKSEFNSDNYQAFKTTNEEYAKLIAAHANYGATIWIHDFHLLLVPNFLANIRPDVKIGFFSHIPTAHPDTWLKMPEARELLMSLSQCRAIGFNTDYARLNLLATFKEFNIIAPSNYTMPIGVNKQPLVTKFSLSDKVRVFTQKIEQLKATYNLDIIVSVDRADCSKGHKTRMQAIQYLIDTQPEITKKILFVSVCPPTRMDVSEEYKELYEYLFGTEKSSKGAIEKLNEHAQKQLSIDYNLIHVIPDSIPGVEIQYLREICDVYLVTSHADGLHLGLLETLSAKLEKNLRNLNGIISTGAGISEYFKPEDGVLVYNPNQLNSHVQLAACITSHAKADNFKKQERAENLAHRFETLRFDMREWIHKARESISLGYNAQKTTNHLLYREHAMHKKAIKTIAQLNIILDIDGVICVEQDENPTNTSWKNQNNLITTADFRDGKITTNNYYLLPGAQAFITFIIKNNFNLKFFSAGSNIRNKSVVEILFNRVASFFNDYYGNTKIFDFRTSIFSAHHRMQAPNDPRGGLRKNLLTALENDHTKLKNTVFIDDLIANAYPGQEDCYLNVPGEYNTEQPYITNSPSFMQRNLQLYFVTAMLHIARQNYLHASASRPLTYFLAELKSDLEEIRLDYRFYEMGFRLLNNFDPNLVLPDENEFYQNNRTRLTT